MKKKYKIIKQTARNIKDSIYFTLPNFFNWKNENELNPMMKRMIKDAGQNAREGMGRLEGCVSEFETFVQLGYQEGSLNKSKNFIGPSNIKETYAERLTDFIHRGVEVPFRSTYKFPKNSEDISPFSPYDVALGVKNGLPETGNCVGTSIIGAYLLKSQGLEINYISVPGHALISANINHENVPIQTTRIKGFNDKPEESYMHSDIKQLEAAYQFNRGCQESYEPYALFHFRRAKDIEKIK